MFLKNIFKRVNLSLQCVKKMRKRNIWLKHDQITLNSY